MGKPSPPQPAPEVNNANAIAMHTQPQPGWRAYDDDAPELDIPQENDDLPPLYDEAAEAGSSSLTAPLLSSEPPTHGLGSDPITGTTTIQPFRREETASYYLSRSLDTDPEILEQYVRIWAATPPRPFVRLRGSHRERRGTRDGRRESRDIVDFDVRVELTPYFCPDLGYGTHRSKHELRTVANGERTRRGTVLRKRAKGAAGDGGGEVGRIELGMVEKPSLAQWCHMYCASHAGLKAFQVKRRLEGLDEGRVKDHLERMVRRTNYRGNVAISFPVQDEIVEVWSDCRTNQWRLTKWIYVLFCVSMLWILTWPYLFFRTKRFETVSSVWNYSTIDDEGRRKYTTISEDQWYNLWGRAISKAVLTKRQGTLDQQDLLASEGPPPQFGTDVGQAVNLVGAGIHAMNEVNRHLGWGENQS